MPASSRPTAGAREALFAPYRALGVVSSGVPLAVQRRGAATFVTAAVGKAWIVYECAKLKTAVVGPLLPHTITALAVAGDLTLAVSGRSIHAHKRLHAVGSFRPPSGHGPPRCLLVLGGSLLAVARDKRNSSGDRQQQQQWSLLVWSLSGGKGGPAPAAVHAFPPGFVPTAVAHPPTYVDKILVGGADGSTQLWNIAAGALLHASTAGADAAAAAGVAPGTASAASARPALRTVCPAPALDVVALGFSNGVVALVDIRADAVLTILRDAAGTGAAGAVGAGPVGAPGAAAGPPPGGAVTALSFCTAPGAAPLLAVGGASGCLALWDLDAVRLAGVLPAAHAPGAAVTTAHWFAGEPRLLTGGGDNALRQWVVASGSLTSGATTAALAAASAPLTLLRSRSGHAAPPALVRFYGPDGTRLLSAGAADRSLRLVSAIQDAQSRELSQGPGLGAQARRLRVVEADLKLPRVVALDACPTRERDWANVLTAHAGDPAARTWTIRDGAATGRALLPPPRPGIPPRTAPATAVAVTACGNYALVGSAAGHVDRYNMQSSMYRGGCTRPGGSSGNGSTQQPNRAKRAHDKAVTGLAPDASGRRAASVGLDGFLRVWDLRTGKPLAEVDLGAPAGRLAAHAGGALVAVALEPGAGGTEEGSAGGAAACGVRVYDIGTSASSGPPRLVRRFFTGGAGGNASSPPLRFTDLAWSADGRWLVASSLDGCVRVADVPAGAVRQTVRLGGPVVSLALSPTGDVLATAHAGRRGICLWSNQAVFGSAGAAPPAGEGAPAVAVRAPVLVAPGGGELGEEEEDKAGTGRPAVTMAGGGRLAPVGVEEEDESDDDDDKREMLSSSSSDDVDRDGARAMSSSSDDSSDDDDDGLDLAAGFESSDDGFASDGDDEDAGPPTTAEVAAEAAAADDDDAVPLATAADGAPAPLAPALITTSLLPRAQWRSLAHLDEVRARNKPLAPPSKPEAAPFFLPTVPTLAGQPVFDPTTATQTDGDGGNPLAGPAPLKRPRHGPGGLVALLRGCAAAAAPPPGTPPPGRWAPVAAWLRSAPPSAVDRELAAMVLIDEEEESGGAGGNAAATEADVGHLLSFVAAKVRAGTDWELIQAFLSAVLRVHGSAIGARPALRTAAGDLAAALKARVARVDGLADAVLASAAFVGGLPA